MKKKYIHVYLIQKYIKDMLKCSFLDHAVYIYIYIYIYIPNKKYFWGWYDSKKKLTALFLLIPLK